MASSVASNEVDLCWRPVADSGATYNVYRDSTLIATTTDTCHVDTTVNANTTYSYTVTFGRGSSESTHSEPAVVTTLQVDSGGDVNAGELRSYTTMQSIGMEWDVSGDTNHNAKATVRFREKGTFVWREALNLIRVDMPDQNMLAGSIMFLKPGTQYEVVLYMTDGDSGTFTQRFNITTRAMPAVPTNGRTLHVVPGSGGGDGTATSPFKGVAAASAVAKAGDVILLHGGNYGGRINFTVGGTEGNLVAYKAAGDGDPVFAGIEVRASHMWIEGLRITAGGGYSFPIGIRTAGAPTNVSVVRCNITGNHYSIWLNSGGSNWYIADNTIVGDNVVESGDFSGEGVEFQHTSGHVMAHNRISLTGDGTSYCERNCDIYGNDIFDTSDDGIEPDGGFANIRIWENRLANTGHNGISMQPMSGAPWYMIRNQIIGNSESPLKYRGSDRFVLMHNTIVNWSNVATIWGYETLNAYSRNNVWITVKGGTIWDLQSGVPSWRTDLDYDGFAMTGSGSAFQFGGSGIKTVAVLAEETAQEFNGRMLDHSCFPTLNVPAGPPASVPEQVVTLAQGCAAIDAGQVLPNINDGFQGAAPDLGAFETGGAPLKFGPR